MVDGCLFWFLNYSAHLYIQIKRKTLLISIQNYRRQTSVNLRFNGCELRLIWNANTVSENGGNTPTQKTLL